jgi:hypothetical protein
MPNCSGFHQPEWYFDLPLTNQTISEMIANLYLNATELGGVNATADVPATYFEVGTLPPDDAGNQTVGEIIASDLNVVGNATLEMLSEAVVGLQQEVAQLKIFMRWQLDAFNAAVQVQDVAVTNEIILAWVALRHELRLDNIESELGIEFDANAIGGSP